MPSIKIWKDELEGDCLPRICMKCGAPSTTSVKKSLRWYPPWVNVFVLVNVLVCLIVAAILMKTASIRAPFCEEHAGHWRVRNRICWLPLLGTFVAFLGGITLAAISDGNRTLSDLGGAVKAVGGGAFIFWAIACVFIFQTGIRPTEITDDSVTFKKVHEEFIAVLKEDREAEDEEPRYRERKASRRAERNDD